MSHLTDKNKHIKLTSKKFRKRSSETGSWETVNDKHSTRMNDSLYNVSTKKYVQQEPEKNRLMSTENLKSSLWSDEEDEFLTTKRINSDSVPGSTVFLNLPVEQECDLVSSLAFEKNKDISTLLDNYDFDFCALCLKKNNFNQKSSFITHLKTCALKNNLSIDQIKQAIQLHQKQSTERKALGLPLNPPDRQKPRKQAVKKEKSDPNLELAMALSVSLRESELHNKIRETEGLLEAGLEREALSQCKKLENYGFVTTRTTDTITQKWINSSRIRNYHDSILFNRSKNERERIITEKIAIILVDSDTHSNQSFFWDTEVHDIKSKYIKKQLDSNASLWRKSYQLSEHEAYDCYYVDNLSSFISPCKLKVGSKLRHLSQIPFRSTSTDNANKKNHGLDQLAHFFSERDKELTLDVISLKSKIEMSNTSRPVPTKKILPEFSKLSLDWKSLINNQISSDITIYVKNGVSVYAHKLVFYVRCRAILVDTIKECHNNDTNEIILWMDFSKESVIAFLEYVYCGTLPNLRNFTAGQRSDFKNLSTRYCIEVLELLVKENSVPEVVDETSISPYNYTTSNIDVESSKFAGMSEGERNLQLLQKALVGPLSPADSVGSLDIFDSDEEVINGNHSKTKAYVDKSINVILGDGFFNYSEYLPENDNDIEIEKNNLLASSVELDNVSQDLFKRKLFSSAETLYPKKLKTDEDFSRSSDNSCDSSVYLDEVISFSELKGATIKTSSKTEMNRIEDDNFLKLLSCEKRTEDRIKANEETTETNKSEVSPYVSPVWDGFESINVDYCDNFYANEIQYSPQIRFENPDTPIINERSSRGEPNFNSFSIDENVLDHIERQIKAQYYEVKTSTASISTPDSTRTFKSRSKSDTILTPVSKNVNDITPIGDYSNMKSNELKKELSRYGLKSGLNRSKAKKLLRYIYDQLHPFENNSREDQSSKNDENIQCIADIQDGEEKYDNSSEIFSGIEVLELSSEGEEIFSQDDTGSTGAKKIDLRTGFKNLIQENENLYKKILLYEPIWLESLEISLKERGVRCSVKELINFLDEECITFRTKQQRGRRKRKEQDNDTRNIKED